MFTNQLLEHEMEEFLASQNITHYFTLTYPRRMSWEGRRKAFLEWVDAIEWLQHRPLAWFRADEMKRFSGLGFPEIPHHHHGLLIDTDDLSYRTAENLWHPYGDALVERYRIGGGAIPYCIKRLTYESEWDLGGKAWRLYQQPALRARLQAKQSVDTRMIPNGDSTARPGVLFN